MNYWIFVMLSVLRLGYCKMEKQLRFHPPNVDINQVTGHLKVNLGQFLNLHDKDDSISNLYVCIGELKSNAIGSLLSDWDIYSCSDNGGPAISVFGIRNQQMLANFNDRIFYVPLHLNKPSTHLLVIKDSPVDDIIKQALYSSVLPPIFSNVQEISTLVLLSDSDSVECQLSIDCISNFYGPRCATNCNPPSNRHTCDLMTGDLACSNGWFGNDCEQKVFIDHKEATQVIKSRQKRANTFLRFEEFSAGNIERECEEETCSREEAREAFEDDVLTEQYWARYTDPNQCVPNPCFPDRTLRCEDKLADYTCHCKPGYQGKNCQLTIDVCANKPCANGQCRNPRFTSFKPMPYMQRHSPTSFACVCTTGFVGSLCERNIDDCVEADCGEHGTCVDGINQYTCSCDLGYTGVMCEVEINECGSMPCQNGGNCTDLVGFYECSCTDDYMGRNCENRVDPCTRTPCLNDGICTLNTDYSYNCTCSPLYTGKNCEHRSDGPCGSTPCFNGGTCAVTTSSSMMTVGQVGDNVTANITEDFTCLCDIGYGGKTCESIIPSCEYARQPCPDNSTCVSLDRQYVCLCPEGFSGEFCNEPGNGTLDKFNCKTDPCMNEARCLSFNNKTTCVCSAGYNGTHCENEINYCESSPCINTGICIPIPGDFICECSPGFNGKYCEVDVNECNEIQCRNNGFCNNTIGSFECLCDAFHSGRFCERDFDPCVSGPCDNGASCIHGDDNYECVCLIGYGGVHCSHVIDPCTFITNPCKNNANCSVDNNDTTQAVCGCLPGYHGRYCEKENDFCVVLSNENRFDIITGEQIPILIPRPDCGLNGDCVNLRTSFICKCHAGFEGQRCENVFNPPIVNCSSEFCQCPQAPFHLIREHNLTTLQCQHSAYETGFCKTPKCLSATCTEEPSLYCEWQSTCLLSERSGSPDCPIMKLHLNQTKLPQNVTVQSYCEFLRNTSSYNRFKDSVAMHCLTPQVQNLTVDVIFDGITSSVDAFLLGSEMFQLLEEQVLSSFQGSQDETISPLASAIIGLEFNIARGHALKPPERRELTSDSENTDSMTLYITLPIALAVLFLLIILLFIVQRRRRREILELTYAGNNTDVITAGDNGSVDRVIVSPTRAKWSKSPTRSSGKIKESFINPLFVDEPLCNGLTQNGNGLAPRPSVISNQYVSPKFEHQSKVTNSTGTDVGRSTIAFKIDQPPSMKVETEYSMASTLPHHMVTIPPPQSSPKRSRAVLNQNPYSFAADGSPRISPRRNHDTNPYEEISLSPSRASQKSQSTDKNVELPDPFVEIARERSPSNEHTYDLDETCDSDGEVNPFKADSDDSAAPPGGIDAIPEAVDTSHSTHSSPARSKPETDACELDDEHYKSPRSYFPEHDALFFPQKSDELPGIYQVPPKTYPPE